MFKSLVDAFCGNRRQLETQRSQDEFAREANAWEKHLQGCRDQLAGMVSARFATEREFNAAKAQIAALEATATTALRHQDEALARDIARSIVECEGRQRESASRLLSLRHRENRLQEILGSSQRLWRHYRNELQLSHSTGRTASRRLGRGDSSSAKLRTLQASMARKRQQEALESVDNRRSAVQQALGAHPDLSSVEIRQPLEDVLGRLRQRAAQPDEE